MKRQHTFHVVMVMLSLLSACAPATQPPPTAISVAPPTPVPTLTLAPTATFAPYVTPAWFTDGVLYQIFVRSFYDSNGDGLGDLDGITQQLDYLQSLGVTSLWLTPIFGSGTYHGYDTTDYYAINPDFGAKADLIELVDAAHARGMRIILDYVASHTSNQHPFFKDALANPASRYSDWYKFKDDKNLNYESFFGVTSLPTIDHTSEAANAYFLDVAKYWMDLDGDGDYTDGIDGWRCDYALGSPHGFWRQLRAALKPLNPDFLLLGEVWVGSASAQEQYYEHEFDALFDFPLFTAVMGDKSEASNDSALAGKIPASITLKILEDEQRLFPPESIPVRFFSNHDTDRLASELSETPDRLRLVPLLLATLDGTPMIYYGEELGLAGHKGTGPLYDEFRREPMPWQAAGGGGEPTWFTPKYSLPDDGISVAEQTDEPGSLLNAYRHALALRAANAALSDGAYQVLRVEPRPGVVAFWRYTDAQIVSAIFNLGLAATTVSLDLSAAPGVLADAPQDLLTGEPLTLDPQAVTLEPGQVLVLDWTP